MYPVKWKDSFTERKKGNKTTQSPINRRHHCVPFTPTEFGWRLQSPWRGSELPPAQVVIWETLVFLWQSFLFKWHTPLRGRIWAHKQDFVMLWLHKQELKTSTVPFYIWSKQKCREGTHCLLEIHEVKMGMIFQQIGSNSLPSKFQAPQRSEMQMPGTIFCKYKLGIVEMQEIFPCRSRVLLWQTLEHTVLSVLGFSDWGLERKRESVRCAINYIYLEFCFSSEPTQFTPKALGSETLCILHDTQVLIEKCSIQKSGQHFLKWLMIFECLNINSFKGNIIFITLE